MAEQALIVVDQFEQWLHAHPGQQMTDLARALRQCDGCHVQCLLLVRDDFWLASTRFAQQLDVPLAEGRNAAAANVSFVEIESDKGHDAFLLDEPEFFEVLAGFVNGCALHRGIG